MAVIHVKIRAPGVGHTDIIHPQTNVDMVVEQGTKVFMTTAERTKLTAIASEANKYVHPTEHAISVITGLQTALDAKQAKITVTGILKGSGNGVVASAVAGTDYVAPGTDQAKITVTGILKGSGNGVVASAVAGTDYMTPAAAQAKITASGILKGAGAGSVGSAGAGTDYVAPSVVGAANGIATLNASSKVNPAQSSAQIITANSNKTLALVEAGALILADSASGITITIPPNSGVAFPVGTEIEIMRYGAGTVTIAKGSGVTAYAVGTPATYTIAVRYGVVVIKQILANVWIISGALT